MLSPAGKLINIEPDVDYSTTDLIFSLHCTKTNECPVILTTIGGTTVTFPIGSFIKGAVYHIHFKKASFNKNEAGFIGYQLLK